MTDDDPGPVHAALCTVHSTNLPCDCGCDQFTAGVDALLAVFARYEPKKAS